MSMDTHESYVSLETAKLLKRAGFDWEVMSFYTNDITEGCESGYELRLVKFDNWNGKNKTWCDLVSAPTLPIAQKWLREVKKKHIEPRYYPSSPYSYKEGWMWHAYNHNPPYESKYMDGDGFFDTYESALEAGIKKSLEIILEKGE